MPSVTVRNLPEEVHRALRIRAAHNGNSTEAEIRNILSVTALPPERVKLGSLLVSIGKEVGGLTDEEVASFTALRSKETPDPLRFE